MCSSRFSHFTIFLYFLRKFKATGKDELALSAFEKIPSNAPDSLNKVFESLSNKQNLILKEYLSWSAYFSGTIHSSLYSPFFFVLPLYLVQTPFTIWQSLIKFFDIEQVNTLPISDFMKFAPRSCTLTDKGSVQYGHLGGRFLRNHHFSGETKNWLEP